MPWDGNGYTAPKTHTRIVEEADFGEELPDLIPPREHHLLRAPLFLLATAFLIGDVLALVYVIWGIPW